MIPTSKFSGAAWAQLCTWPVNSGLRSCITRLGWILLWYRAGIELSAPVLSFLITGKKQGDGKDTTTPCLFPADIWKHY